MKKEPYSKFVGQPKSLFDFDWMKRVGRKMDALLNGTMTNGAVHYGDGNTVWEGGGVGGGGLNPRGEWSASAGRPGGKYKKLDLVVIRAGSNAGTFYALQDVPDSGAGIAPTLPDTGNQYWLCISNSPSMGQWM